MSRPFTKERPPTKKYPPIRVIDTSKGPLVPEGHFLWHNPELGTISLLTTFDNAPCLIAEQQFPAAEECIVDCLFRNYPHYAPYERMLAHFNFGTTATEAQVLQMRRELAEAHEVGGMAWDELMRPTRNVTSRARPKLLQLGIMVVALDAIGYVLMPVHSRELILT